MTLLLNVNEVKDTTETRRQASDSVAYTVQLGQPHFTFTGPLDEATWGDATGVDITWTYSDDRALPQQDYRFVLKDDGGGVLVDTGWVVSTGTSARIDWPLLDGYRYTIDGQARNTNGILSD